MSNSHVYAELDGRDSLRKELEEKIERRVTLPIFQWTVGLIVGALIVVLGGAFSFFVVQISDIRNKVEKLNDRTTILETRFNYANGSESSP